MRVWAEPPADARITATAGTSTRPPARPPRLLFAGLIDGVMVVVLHDGERLVRYAEPEAATPTLHFARVDDADVTTGAALVIGRGNGWMRYLIAPWVSDATTRDLLAPDAPARPLHLAPDGVTDRVPTPPEAATACGRWPVVQFRSSQRIAEDHTFLVTDLGDLAPAHLSYLPAPAGGAPPQPPREATGPEGLRSWARTACSLRSLRGEGVRSVNNWEFARQRLPEGAARRPGSAAAPTPGAVPAWSRCSSSRPPRARPIPGWSPAGPGTPPRAAASGRMWSGTSAGGRSRGSGTSSPAAGTVGGIDVAGEVQGRLGHRHARRTCRTRRTGRRHGQAAHGRSLRAIP